MSNINKNMLNAIPDGLIRDRRFESHRTQQVCNQTLEQSGDGAANHCSHEMSWNGLMTDGMANR